MRDGPRHSPDVRAIPHLHPWLSLKRLALKLCDARAQLVRHAHGAQRLRVNADVERRGRAEQALFALHALQETNAELRKRLVFLWTSDEEIGSESSRKLLEAEARRSDAVFVLEPSFGPRGLLKTARKGVGITELTVHGRASHAGLADRKSVV